MLCREAFASEGVDEAPRWSGWNALAEEMVALCQPSPSIALVGGVGGLAWGTATACLVCAAGAVIGQRCHESLSIEGTAGNVRRLLTR